MDDPIPITDEGGVIRDIRVIRSQLQGAQLRGILTGGNELSDS